MNYIIFRLSLLDLRILANEIVYAIVFIVVFYAGFYLSDYLHKNKKR